MQPQVQAPGKWPNCEGEGRRGLGPTGLGQSSPREDC